MTQYVVRTKTHDPRPWVEHLAIMSRHWRPGDQPAEHGPWDNEPDDAQWIDAATGYPCWAKRTHWGTWCGYVSVPRSHPLWGKEYDDAEVHGGITFMGPWLDEGDWWFGFDCGHAWDIGPVTPGWGFSDSAYRTLNFVIEQCTGLAAQLQALGASES